jgi:hypothetical protein
MGEWKYSSTFHYLGSRWRCVVSYRALPLYPAERDPRTDWIGDWVGPIVGLDAVKRKILHCRELKPEFSNYFLKFVLWLLLSDTSVGIATSCCWIYGGGSISSIGKRFFSLLHGIQTGFGVHPGSYQRVSGTVSPGVWSWPLTFI